VHVGRLSEWLVHRMVDAQIGLVELQRSWILYPAADRLKFGAVELRRLAGWRRCVCSWCCLFALLAAHHDARVALVQHRSDDVDLDSSWLGLAPSDHCRRLAFVHTCSVALR